MDKNAIRSRVYTARTARYAPGSSGLAARDTTAAALAEAGLALVRDVAPASDRVVTFVSMRTEPPMHALNAALVESGFEVVAPVTLDDLDLDWARLGEDVVAAVTRVRLTGNSGHSALLGPDAVTSADLLFVPGVAVDSMGTRLGRGGGSYDRALARRHPGSRIVVVLHDDEVVDMSVSGAEPLPREPHDEVVDGVLTPSGHRWFGRVR